MPQKRNVKGVALEFEQILGIRFFRGNPAQAVDLVSRVGGLLVVPASPALTKLGYDDGYRRALQEADVALLDSGFIALIWKLLTHRKVDRISSSAYLRSLLSYFQTLDEGEVVWVVGASENKRVSDFLHTYSTGPINHRVLSSRASSENHELLLKLEELRPGHVVIATPGGGQEELGLYLRQYLLYRPSLHCVGSALAFLTGAERPVPSWAENSRLGWLTRLASQPRMLFPRLAIAISLLLYVVRYRSELPPLRLRWADV
ncbi:MAG: WecB/TagA/CpsF family glycosyltransferase [Chthoniobacterales bacterium]